MSKFIVDVESDGPAPGEGLFSMVSFGVVEFTRSGAGRTFYGEVAPISDRFIPDALATSGFSREKHLSFEKPAVVMPRFLEWLKEVNGPGRAVFVSDNPAFDWSFMNWYLWSYCDCNPFGHSARRIGDFHAGMVRDFDAPQTWKKLRRTKHTHHPVDDAKGNAEALLALMEECRKGRHQPTRGSGR